jgi:hypothetical protein
MSTQYNIPSRGDNINGLPIDKNPPTQNELYLVNNIFEEPNKGILAKLKEDMKDTVLIALLFIAFSLPQIDGIIHKIIPSTTNSTYILLAIKSIMMACTWWIIRYFYLSRK